MTVPPLAAGPDWGTVPDWLAAIGTLAAFAVALRLLAKELAARREQEEDRRREQASRVACWVGMIKQEPGRRLGPMIAGEFPLAVGAVLHNGSQEPVHDCQVHLELDPAAEGSFFKVVDGAFQWGERRTPLRDRTLPPGRIQHSLSLGRADIPHVSVLMTFTDAAGRRWTRHPDGQLEGSPPEARRSAKDRLDAFAKGQVEELDS